MKNSTDSENVNPQVSMYLTAMRAEIGNLRIDLDKKQEALKIVNALDMQFETGKPDKAVVNNLLNDLPRAAIIASISSSLRSCL